MRGTKWGFKLEDIRQWLLIYEEEGTEAQMQAWVSLADTQLVQLAEQKAQLNEAIQELQDMRNRVADELGLS